MKVIIMKVLYLYIHAPVMLAQLRKECYIQVQRVYLSVPSKEWVYQSLKRYISNYISKFIKIYIYEILVGNR